MDREFEGALHARPRTYEITLVGRAGSALRAEFEDCDILVGPDTTTLRAELLDHAAFTGLLMRIADLGLTVIKLHRVEPPAH